MGSAGSKASRAAGSAAARRYPTKPSAATRATPASAPSTAQQPTVGIGPTVHSNEGPSDTRDRSINADASDPVLASKLRQIGPVAANPYQSHTSTQYVPPSRNHNQAARGLPAELAPLGNEPPPGLFPDPATMRNNPALLVMHARKRWQEKADAELEDVGRSGFVGREMMDVGMVTDALRMRRRGVGDKDIEKRLGLRQGVLGKLGPPGVLEAGYGG